jgi:alpha-beta hydrolase superfamily lysophospholipase
VIGILAALGLYVAILLIVAFAALRPARSPIFLSPAALGAPVEDVEFDSSGIKLRGWWMPVSNPRWVAVLMHGYVMNRSENAAIAAALRDMGCASLLFDSRASGKSDGTRVGFGVLEADDVLAACRFAETKAPGVPRVLIGSSMGAAAAAFALERNPDCAAAAILDSAYHTLPSATLGWWRFIGGRAAQILLAPTVLVAAPFARFNPFRASVGRALAAIDKPILITHGTADRLVSYKHAEANFAAAKTAGRTNVRLKLYEGAGHSEARWTHAAEFLSDISAMLAEVAKEKVAS